MKNVKSICVVWFALILVAGCARHVADRGVMITGFSIDRAYGLATWSCFRVPVEQDEILVRFPAPHVHADGVVVARVDPGERAHRAEDVGLTEEARR